MKIPMGGMKKQINVGCDKRDIGETGGKDKQGDNHTGGTERYNGYSSSSKGQGEVLAAEHTEN